ncbi:YbhB/YbcL family Raf kinase inhibitor-like protein [bacterium]|nr:YbhB/YbcL family Raf kinase inhibitor-like protein [bacterium]
MQITSSAFAPGGPIPKKYTGDGADVSPALEWKGLPADTKELALICDDPDAPRADPWVHWVVYNIPASATGLSEGIGSPAAISKLPGAQLGKNSWGKLGYNGPMPPPGHGRHRYYFKLYALSEPLKLKAGASKEELLAAIKGKLLDEAEVMGTYQR